MLLSQDSQTTENYPAPNVKSAEVPKISFIFVLFYIIMGSSMIYIYFGDWEVGFYLGQYSSLNSGQALCHLSHDRDRISVCS
jgi:hypothetical protein